MKENIDASAQMNIDTNAVLAHTSLETRQELTLAISNLLNGLPVSLGETAFLDESRLLIERKMHLDHQGLPLQGRSLERPEAFVLIKRGKHCLIKHEASEKTVLLNKAKCKTAPNN